jgi:hypothetical protein
MSEDAGTKERDRLRRIAAGQHDIFMNMVLYSPPAVEMDLANLLELRNGPLLAAAREYRAWLAKNPQAFCPDPNDVADLTCEDP